MSVRLSVCPVRPLNAAAVGLLLLARRAGDIDRLLLGAQHQLRRSTARSSRWGQCHVVSTRRKPNAVLFCSAQCLFQASFFLGGGEFSAPPQKLTIFPSKLLSNFVL